MFRALKRDNESLFSLQAKFRGHAQAFRRQKLSDLRYDLSSIWLFTYSDMKTIMFPQSIFGTMTALAAYSLGQPTSLSPTVETIVVRFPIALFWTWINLLPFNIQNQLDDSAIEEDRVNKPWRPLPSGRVSTSKARIWMYLFYCAAVLASIQVGGLRQCVALLGLGYWYNRAGGSDCSWAVRNLINAYGFISFASGAMECALGSPVLPTRSLVQWFGIIGAIVFSTVQTQDMYDMEGDSARGRSTLPLVVGDVPARWSIAIAVMLFTYVCPLYWNAQWSKCLFVIGLGCAVSIRTLRYRTVAADKRTFQLWNLWLVSIYTIPIVKHFLG